MTIMLEQRSEPDKVYVGAFIRPEVGAELEAVARRNHRSKSGELRLALERHLETEREP